ncbi:hypothetical protein ACFYKX_10115 [Cytobacillus sp. FJAT-54145]|uniref:Uncharacterized protein n=1 Tax=Cytobacillus spartinae TaxID=3299023 RepID=A0ABW6K9T3_9BACI
MLRYFKTRSKEEYEDYENWDTWNTQQAYSWEEIEEGFQVEPTSPFTLRALILMSAALLYGFVLLLGIFTTDFHNGRGYIVSSELRQERAYIESLNSYYEVLLRTPDAIVHLEGSVENKIEVQYQLTQLSDTIRTMTQKEKGRKDVPDAYRAYQGYLVQLADLEMAYLTELTAYYQDQNQERIPRLQELQVGIVQTIQNAQVQMDDIRERLKRNQQKQEVTW